MDAKHRLWPGGQKPLLLRTAMVMALAALPAAALVPADSTLPMKRYSLGNHHYGFVPPNRTAIRGVMFGTYVADNTPDPGPGHTVSILCHLWDFAYLLFDLRSPGDVGAAFRGTASKSGHPEIANAPFLSTLGRYNEPIDTFVKSNRDRCIAYDAWITGVEFGGNDIPRMYNLYECREQSTIPTIPNMHKALRAKGVPLTYFPIWGWPRGNHSAREYRWAFFDWAVKTRLPNRTVPADGKVRLNGFATAEGTWLGDPATWTGEWATIAPYDSYAGDKSLSSWMPNEYLAYVWKALVARDPTKTQSQAGSWGALFSSDHAGNNFGCSAQPPIGVIAPVKHYRNGANSPMFPLDTVIRVRVATDYRDFKEMRLFDGNRLLATFLPSAYGVYFARCTLSTPGVRSLLVHATLADGKEVTSRPATLFVGKERSRATRALSGKAGGNRPLIRIADGGRLELGSTVPARVEVEVFDIRGRLTAGPWRHYLLEPGVRTLTPPVAGGGVGPRVVVLEAGNRRRLAGFRVRP